MSNESPHSNDPIQTQSGGQNDRANNETSSDPTSLDDEHQSTIRSPSPRKLPSITSLGMNLPSVPTLAPPASSSSSSSSSSSVIITYPHLAHYIFNLLNNVHQSSSLPSAAPQHPLSVSSSGESDGSDEDSDQLLGKDDDQNASNTPGTHGEKASKGDRGVDREALVNKVVQLLDNEQEEEMKALLKSKLGDLGKDDILMDQICLDCMHRRKDDFDQVPYSSHLTPTRARASPSLASHPLRPYTPTRVPSFRARTPLGRPQSPAPSTGGHPTSNLAKSDSSPTLAAGSVGPPSSSGYSSSGSPISSPRMLNVKAAMFNPSPRSTPAHPTPSATPTTAAAFSPSDPWKDIAADPPRSASPFGAIAAPGMVRTNSNLAIAAPLLSRESSPFHSPMGTPSRTYAKMPDVYVSPVTTPHTSKGLIPEDDDDDEFSPFGSGLPKLHHLQPTLSSSAKAFEPFGSSDYSGASSLSSSMTPSDPSTSYDSRGSRESSAAASELTPDELNQVSVGMTPLDVLCSVFTSIPPVELEDALHRSGYDFEGAMAILVSQHTLPRSGSSTPQRVSSPRPLLNVSGRGPLQIQTPRDGYFQQGGRGFGGNVSPGLGGMRSPGPGGSRMCRYYLAGECRRSDCRFSHDIDRALCRFWLRGHCAKGTNCEFLHHLPNNMDPQMLSSAMSRVELSSDGSSRPSTPPVYSNNPVDEFPDLLAARLGRPQGRFDPSRNRFANAVKRPIPGPINMPINPSGARSSPSTAPYSPSSDLRGPSVAPVPRPSHRLKLRPPTLLPTLRTGSTANDQYLNIRSQSIRLGHARNACLARAADAFRRGDGAAAKRFSREGKQLNERMLNESLEAAMQLVRERQKEAQKAVREREYNWSDDPRDRLERGKLIGGGLGVIMGVAATRVAGPEISSEERMECLLDLHTLHGNEGADILGQFLIELERENYRGLAYIIVGEEKHVGSQDPARGASKVRLSASVKQYLADWGHPWSEGAGIICVDPCRY